MSASNKDNKDFDNSDDSISREYIDPNNKQKWSSNKKVIEDKWLEPMHLVLVTLQYLNDCLKDREATVGWWLILITSFTSFLTLFSPKELGTGVFFNTHYDWTKGVLLSILSFTATLMASWAKKKGFVKRIKDLDKRIYSLETKRSVVSSVLTLPIEDRPQYITFYKDNIVEVQDLLCYNQLISPTEMSDVLYNLTKNYPNLIKDISPWYTKNPDGTREADYEYGYNIIKSFEKRRLNGLFFRILSCFYCKSSCCYDLDDGNPFTNKQIMSQIVQHKKDDASTKSSKFKAKNGFYDREPIHPANLMNILSETNDLTGVAEENNSNLFNDFIDKGSSRKSQYRSSRRNSNNMIPGISIAKNSVLNNANNNINMELSEAINKITSEKTQMAVNMNNGLNKSNANAKVILSHVNNSIDNKTTSQSDETVVNIAEVLLDSDNDSNLSNNNSSNNSSNNSPKKEIVNNTTNSNKNDD